MSFPCSIHTTSVSLLPTELSTSLSSSRVFSLLIPSGLSTLIWPLCISYCSAKLVFCVWFPVNTVFIFFIVIPLLGLLLILEQLNLFPSPVGSVLLDLLPHHVLCGAFVTTTICVPSMTVLSPLCASVVILFSWTLNSLWVGFFFQQLRPGEPQPTSCQAGPALGPHVSSTTIPTD